MYSIEKFYLHHIDQIHNVLLCYFVELRLHPACTFHRSTTWTGQSRVHDAWGRLRDGDGEATGKCCFLNVMKWKIDTYFAWWCWKNWVKCEGNCKGIRLPIHFYFDDDLELESPVTMFVNGSWPFKWGVRKSGCNRISKHEIQSAWLRFIHHATSCGKVPARWTCIPQGSWYRQAWNSAEMRPY